MGASGQVLLLDGAADRDQRPERQRGVAVVCEAGHPQKGGKMSANTLSYILSALSLTSLWLMGNKSVWGIWIGLLNQALWIAYALMLKQYGLLIGVCAYTIIHIRNLEKWTREE